MRNCKNMILSRNLQSENMRAQKNLNPCPRMLRRRLSEHFAMLCSCSALFARRRNLLALMAGAGEDPSPRLRFAAKIVHPSFSKLIKFSSQTYKTNIQASFRRNSNTKNQETVEMQEVATGHWL